jgi:hypothetical protein
MKRTDRIKIWGMSLELDTKTDKAMGTLVDRTKVSRQRMPAFG